MKESNDTPRTEKHLLGYVGGLTWRECDLAELARCFERELNEHARQPAPVWIEKAADQIVQDYIMADELADELLRLSDLVGAQDLQIITEILARYKARK